jgi:hypothetical protein
MESNAKSNRRKNQESFIINFMGPEFGLVVSGGTRDECERTFYGIFAAVLQERISATGRPAQPDRMVQ